MANSFLLKMQYVVSESLRSSAVSNALNNGVVSVIEELVPGVVFVGELSKKVTRALLGVDFADFPRGIFEVEFIE